MKTKIYLLILVIFSASAVSAQYYKGSNHKPRHAKYKHHKKDMPGATNKNPPGGTRN